MIAIHSKDKDNSKQMTLHAYQPHSHDIGCGNILRYLLSNSLQYIKFLIKESVQIESGSFSSLFLAYETCTVLQLSPRVSSFCSSISDDSTVAHTLYTVHTVCINNKLTQRNFLRTTLLRKILCSQKIALRRQKTTLRSYYGQHDNVFRTNVRHSCRHQRGHSSCVVSSCIRHKKGTCIIGTSATKANASVRSFYLVLKWCFLRT